MVKLLPAMQETQVWSLGWEDPLEKEMATHSSTLAWKIPWTEEPGRLQSMGSQRVGHDWATSLYNFYFCKNTSDTSAILQFSSLTLQYCSLTFNERHQCFSHCRVYWDHLEGFLQCGRSRFNPWVRKIPWRRAGQPIPVFLPGESHGQRSLAGYSPCGHKELDTSEVT